jgi:hypothetical protein
VTLKFLSSAGVILFLSGCVSAEQYQASNAMINECLNAGGVAHRMYSSDLPRCILNSEKNRLDDLEMECVKSGGRPIYTKYLNTNTRVYDNCSRGPSTIINNNTQAQPLFKPYCPPSPYPIYGCN